MKYEEVTRGVTKICLGKQNSEICINTQMALRANSVYYLFHSNAVCRAWRQVYMLWSPLENR